MKKYIIHRVLHIIPVLFGLTFLSFSLLYLAPGDPAQRKLMSQGVAVTSDIVEITREEMGLNRPFLVQYAHWCRSILQGDMGTSYKDGTPVVNKLWKGMKYTSVLAVSAFAIAILISVPVGIYAAVRRGRPSDRLIRLLCFGGNAVPGFLLSILLIYFFCIRINFFPVVARANVQGLILPSLSLAIPLTSRLIRQVRAAVLEQLSSEYVMAARMRGVREQYILFKNVLHNAMISIVTVAGLSVGVLLGGSVVIESIFLWPGIGKVVMDSITARDYPVIQGFAIIMAITYVMVNLMTDISYRLLDPRVKE